MKILHVIPSISPTRGGPSVAVLAMVRALNDRGIDAEIATTNDDGSGILDVPLHRLTRHQGAPIRFFPRFSPPIRAMREYAYAPAFRSWLRSHVADYDLVHVHALFSYLPTTALRVARHSGIPYISRPLGQLGAWPMQQSALRKRLHYAAFEQNHLRHAAALHFTSEAECVDAERLNLSTPKAVIPHGIDLPESIPDAKAKLRQELGLALDARLVLFLSRLHAKKGLDLLIPAFATLRDPSAVLLIAGNGEPAYEREVDALIREHACTRIIRLGFVSGERKQLLLQGSDVFALPSRHENFGLAALEVLASGTPTLLSDQVALVNKIRGLGFGEVIPLDVQAISRALRRLLSQPSQTEAMRAFVECHYTWGANAAALENLYASILQRNNLGSPSATGSNGFPHESNCHLRARPGGVAGQPHRL